LITQTITVTIFDRDDVVALANFQLELLQRQAARNAAVGASYTSTPLETPMAAQTAPAPAKPTVETTTGPLTAAVATSAPAIVTTAPPTDADVVDAFRAYITAKGPAAARALLDKYSATRVGDVKPADIAAFLAEVVNA
jgi:hypothetical protein